MGLIFWVHFFFFLSFSVLFSVFHSVNFVRRFVFFLLACWLVFSVVCTHITPI